MNGHVNGHVNGDVSSDSDIDGHLTNGYNSDDDDDDEAIVHFDKSSITELSKVSVVTLWYLLYFQYTIVGSSVMQLSNYKLIYSKDSIL